MAKVGTQVWLDGNFLLPASDGLITITVKMEWLVEPVLSVALAMAVDAKWACGVDNYFNLPCVVTSKTGELKACPPMSRAYVDQVSPRLFAPNAKHLVSVVHYVLQHTIVLKFPRVKRVDPFDLDLKSCRR